MLPKGPLAKLAANPNASSIFRRSKAQNKQIAKEPEWDIADNSVTMKAIVQDRSNAVLLDRQEKMRADAKVDAKRNKKRIEEVRRMQEKLRQKFIETNNFICECERKEAIVAKKIAEEEAIGEQLQKEYDELKEEYETMNDWHENTFKPAIDKLKIYEDVLQEVVDESDLFKSKEDFLDRLKALFLAQSEVAKNDETNLKEVEESEADIVKTSNEITLMVAGYENQFAELKKKQEKAKSEVLKLEDILPEAEEIITEEEKEAFMELDQIQQLYLMFCQRNGIEPEFKREQVEEQLDFIKMEIEIMFDIIKMANEMMDLESRSDIAEHGSGRSGKPRK